MPASVLLSLPSDDSPAAPLPKTPVLCLLAGEERSREGRTVPSGPSEPLLRHLLPRHPATARPQKKNRRVTPETEGVRTVGATGAQRRERPIVTSI